MGLINKAFKFVFDKNYRFLALDQRGVYNSMDDKEYLERQIILMLILIMSI